MKKCKILILLFGFVLLSGCGKTESDTEEIVLTDNQSYVFGQISEIAGNEITFTVAEEVSMEDMQNMGGTDEKSNGTNETEQSTNEAESTSENSSAMGRPTGNEAASDTSQPAGNEAASDMGRPAGDEEASDIGQPADDEAASDIGQSAGNESNDRAAGPAMNGGTWEQSEDSEGSDQARMPAQENWENRSESGGTGSEEGSEDENTSDREQNMEDRVMYKLTDEVKTMMIPVGTEVVTKLETVTTFSRLAAGDTIKMLMEKDGDTETILKIWIVG